MAEIRLVEVVQAQLPRAIVDKIRFDVVSDPFHLRTKLRVKDDRERVYECELEYTEHAGRQIACKVPELFLARLCAEV